jgi:hypothetical protein
VFEQCQNDLGHDDRLEINAFFNHDHDSDELIHWCVCGCCGSDEECLATAIRIASKSLCIHPDTPLLYRWKHWEQAVSYTLRGVRLHNLPRRVLGVTMSRLPVEVPAPSADELDENLSFAQRQQIRGQKTLQLLGSANIGVQLGMIVLAGAPVERFMNAAFKADQEAQRMLFSLHDLTKGLDDVDLTGIRPKLKKTN